MRRMRSCTKALRPSRFRISPHRFFDFRNPVGTLEDFAWLGAIRGADDAVLFHQIDEVCGAAVANSQAALEEGSGRLAELHNQFHCVTIHRILFAIASLARFSRAAGRPWFTLVGWDFEELLLIFGLALRLPEFNNGRNFFLRDKRCMQSVNAR